MDEERRFVGTGITRQQLFKHDDPAAADIIERGTIEGLCGQIERECFAIMRANDLPDCHWPYFHDDAGNWTFEIPQGGPWGWRCCNDLSSIVRKRGYEPDSIIGFAAGMLCDVVWLRRSLQENDGERAAMHAFYLGIKWATRRLKAGWEAAALVGQPMIESGRARRKGRLTKAERVAEVNRLRALPMSAKAAILQVAEEEGVSRQTIEAEYYPRKKKST